MATEPAPAEATQAPTPTPTEVAPTPIEAAPTPTPTEATTAPTPTEAAPTPTPIEVAPSEPSSAEPTPSPAPAEPSTTTPGGSGSEVVAAPAASEGQLTPASSSSSTSTTIPDAKDTALALFSTFDCARQAMVNHQEQVQKKMAELKEAEDQLETKRKENNQLIENERQKLREQHQALSDEKELCRKAVEAEGDLIKKTFKDDDIIYLNAAGKKFTVSRSTFTQVPKSLLAAMFSGRWEESLSKDKEGNVFLDVDPDCFSIIVNWLRSEKLQPLTPFPKVTEDQQGTFDTQLAFFGLQHVITHRRLVVFAFENFKPYDRSLFNISEDGQTVTDMRDDRKEWCAVATAEKFGRGVYEIVLQAKGRIFIDFADSWSTMYNQDTCKLRSLDQLNYASNKEDKTLTITVNCTTKTASAVGPTLAEPVNIGLKGQGPSWRMYVGFYAHASFSIKTVTYVS